MFSLAHLNTRRYFSSAVDSLRKKQLSKADEAGDFDPTGSEEGACTTEEKESSLAASSSLSLIGDSTLGGGGSGAHHHVPTSSYVNASTVVAAALAAAAAQRSAAKATSATAPLPATSTASGPSVSSHHHDHHCQKTEGRWRPGSWLRRSFVLLWRRRASPASATAAVTASCAKPLLQDDIMRQVKFGSPRKQFSYISKLLGSPQMSGLFLSPSFS